MRNVIIIGSGPAAWTAALYLARADLNPLVIGGKTPGGQLMNTTEVENYPGSVDGITGPELISVMEKQAKKFGTEVINDEVSEVKKTSKGFEINYGDGKKEESLAVIISTGSSYRHLGVPGEEEFSAKGVSYCAVCLPPDEAVIGNSSVKHISSIKEKQEVLTHDGSFQEVVGTTKRKFKGDLVKIKTRYFTEPVLLTKNHPVMSSTLARGSGANYWKDTSFSNPIWVKAGALKKGDLVHYPIIKKTQDIKNLLLSDLVNVRVDNKGLAHNLSETHTSKSIPNKIPLTKSFMRLVGYYLSEGSIFKHSFALYFSKKEKEYIKDASNLIRNIFGLEPRLIIKDNVCKVVAYSYLLCNFFESLFSKKSFAKKLPHWMLHLPLAKQREIIKGFYRGDGCMREKDYVLVSNSRQLVYQFRDILLRFGILPSITRRNKDQLNKKDHFIDGRKISFRHDKYHMVVKNGDSIRLMDQVLGEKHNILTKRIRSNSFAWIRNNYVLLPVTSVESESYGGYVHNIAVKKNNTYVAKNFIVHNCDAPFFKDKKTLVVGGG
ncbi:MAG: FAD-dependent oxidoreductase, partial [Candidatus Woesearchaeota archaeon]|nr:FAD-dependent oxidoreductase [Candidatus Woesearchaeota archaeon]